MTLWRHKIAIRIAPDAAEIDGMYEATTQNIRVRVEPHYDEQRSNPRESRYFWLYAVDITNEGEASVKLLARYWRITDSNGAHEEIRGPGVVGKTPTLEPGDSFSYTSGCPLRTPSGIMVGAYEMVRADGERLVVQIPAFSLDSPDMRPSLN